MSTARTPISTPSLKSSPRFGNRKDRPSSTWMRRMSFPQRVTEFERQAVKERLTAPSGGRARLRSGPRCGALAGLARAFGGVGRAVDHLQVGGAPEGEELRPRPVAVLAPDPEEGRHVVDLGALEEPRA